MNLQTLFWMLILVITVGCMIVFGLDQKRKKKKENKFVKRSLPALKELEKQRGLAIESGQRMHVAVGNSDLLGEGQAASLLGIDMMENLARNSAASDRPLIATTSDGTVALLLQSRLHHQYTALNLKDLYRPQLGQLSGTTPFAYSAGVLPLIHDEGISVNIAAGKLGPEIGLIAEAGQRQKAALIGGSSAPEGQAVIYAMTDSHLIGEEIFAAPAYLKDDKKTDAGLKTQDILRFTLVCILLLGSVLKLVGVL